MLEKCLWNSFLLYMPVEILQLAHEVNSFQEVLYKKMFWKTQCSQNSRHQSSNANIANLMGKRLCWSLYLIMLRAWELATLMKKSLQRWCFPVKFAKYLGPQTTASKLDLKRDSNTGAVLWTVKFSRTPILNSIRKRLVLKHQCWGLFLIKLQAWRPEGM